MISVTIPITDDGDQCNSFYGVEYKRDSDAGYTQAPNALSAPIVIDNLDDETPYTFRITRYCCNGNYSGVLIVTHTTGGSSLDAPANFTATGFSGEIELEWDNDVTIDSYVIERDTSNTFPSPTEIYNGVYASPYLDSPLLGTYYYRIRAVKSGFPDSPYSTAFATAT